MMSNPIVKILPLNVIIPIIASILGLTVPSAFAVGQFYSRVEAVERVVIEQKQLNKEMLEKLTIISIQLERMRAEAKEK